MIVVVVIVVLAVAFLCLPVIQTWKERLPEVQSRGFVRDALWAINHALRD